MDLGRLAKAVGRRRGPELAAGRRANRAVWESMLGRVREERGLPGLATLPRDDARELLAEVRRRLAVCPSCGCLHAPDDPTSTVPLCPACRGVARSRAASGERLGRYRVVGRLGAGGMGEVLHVVDEDLGRDLAAKVVLGEPTPRQRQKLVGEARLTGRLEHPNIVPMHELGATADGRLFFTMKRVDGEDLAAVLASGRLGRTALLGVFTRVCDAVAFAHSRGVIHRDLKPANVMLGAFGEVLVMDWGLAKVVGRDEGLDAGLALPGDAALQTRDGTVLGTPAYMPPEQARGEVERLGPASDVYALGAMLYHVLAGAPPYQGTGREVVLQIARGDRPRPADDVPWELAAVLDRAMAHDPADRYPDAGALREDVARYLDHRELTAARYRPSQRLAKWVRRHPALTASAALLLAVTAALGWHHRRQAEATRHQRVAAAAEEARGLLADQPDASALRAALRARAEAERTRPTLLRRDWSRALETHLGAASALDRAMALATRDEQPPLRRARRAVGVRLSLVALLSRDHALARQAIVDLERAGLTDDDRARLLAEVDRERSRRRAWERTRLERMLADLSAAGRERHFPGWTSADYLVAAASLSPEVVVAVLGPALHELGRRAEVGAVWTDGDRRRIRFVCTALGQVRAEESARLLGQFTYRLRDRRLLAVVGRALCHTSHPLAARPLHYIRGKLTFDQQAAAQLELLMAQVPKAAPGAGAGSDDWFGRTVAAIEHHDWKTARQLASRALEGDLSSNEAAHARILRAYATFMLGDRESALAQVDRHLRESPSTRPRFHFLRGIMLRLVGRHAEAERELDRAIAADPREYRYHQELCLLHAELGRDEQALAAARRAAELGLSDSPLIHARIGTLLFRLGRLDEALEACETAVRLGPESGYTYLARGECRLAREEWKLARDDLERARRELPDHGPVLGSLGFARSRCGDLEGAREMLTAALARPGSAEWKARAFAERAWVLQRLKQLPEALADIDRALALDPPAREVPNMRYRRALILREAGRARQAIAAFGAVLERVPGHVPSLKARGVLLTQAGEHAAALRDFEAVTRRAPRSWVAWATCALSRANVALAGRSLPQMDRARTELETARRLAPPAERAKVDAYLARWAAQRATLAGGGGGSGS